MEKKVTMSRLISQHVNPEGHFLFVGAFDSCHKDPSVLYALLRQARRGRGRIYLLDSQASSLSRRMERRASSRSAGSLTRGEWRLSSRLAGLPKAGTGDAGQYQGEVRHLVKSGVTIRRPIIVFGTAMETGIKKNQKFEAVFDIGTLRFAAIAHAKQLGIDEKKVLRDPAFLSRFFLEYARVGRRLVLVTHSVREPLLGDIKTALLAAGAIKIEQVPVENKYWMTMPPETPSRPIQDGGQLVPLVMKHTHSYDTALVVEWGAENRL